MNSGGKTREAKARRKIAENSRSRPPIPICWKSQSGLIKALWVDFLNITFKFIFYELVRNQPFASPD